MTRQRVNPFDRGTPEHTLHQHWRKAKQRAAELDGYMKNAEAQYQRRKIEYEAVIGAERAKADHYAKALTALGHPPEPLRIAGPK